MRIRPTYARIAGVVFAAVVASSACGTSPTSSSDEESQGPTKAEQVYAELNKMPPSEQHAELVKRANEEGALAVYTSMTSEVTDEVIGAFEDTYDDLDVSVYRADSETVLQRVLQEQQAQFYGNDVVESNATEMIALEQEGLMSHYRGAPRDAVSDLAKFDTWTGDPLQPVLAELEHQAGQAGRAADELGGPRRPEVGRQALHGDRGLRLVPARCAATWQKQGKSRAGDRPALQPRWPTAPRSSRATPSRENCSPPASSPSSPPTTATSPSTPSAAGRRWTTSRWCEPVIARPNGLGLMKTAEHPAAAMLFADWLLTEGQKVMADLGLTPSVESMDPFQGREVVPVDTDKLLKQGEEWSKQYEEVVQQGDEVES